ncbi:MAG: phosphoribosylamine--glycine ligase [Halanaerobiales bacterium]
MKVLVVGNGGREHGIVWKLSQSDKVDQIYIAPGNAGTADLGENIDVDVLDIDGLVNFARSNNIDITFVGPEDPLVAGIVDRFEEEGLRIFGPNRKAAQLEGSKVFSKNIMEKYDIPTAEYRVFRETDQAISYIKEKGAPIVVKADGLAAGKGVIVAGEVSEAVEAVESILLDEQFGEAGARIVVEEFLAGEEATVLAFVDGDTIIPMIPSQDHKQAYDGDEGPNTGGMGAYAPAPVVDDSMMEKISKKILRPTLEALKAEGVEYKGVLYCGLMIKDGVPKVLEYNVRFGDPETQVVLPLLKTDLVDIVEAVIDGNLADIDVEWYDQKALCVIMASGGYPLDYEKGKKITGVDEACSLDDVMVFQAGVRREADDLLTAGGRVLAVTALGDSFEEVIEKAYAGIEYIHFNDYHIRHDIGYKALNR